MKYIVKCVSQNTMGTYTYYMRYSYDNIESLRNEMSEFLKRREPMDTSYLFVDNPLNAKRFDTIAEAQEQRDVIAGYVTNTLVLSVIPFNEHRPPRRKIWR